MRLKERSDKLILFFVPRTFLRSAIKPLVAFTYYDLLDLHLNFTADHGRRSTQETHAHVSHEHTTTRAERREADEMM